MFSSFILPKAEGDLEYFQEEISSDFEWNETYLLFYVIPIGKTTEVKDVFVWYVRTHFQTKEKLEKQN